MYRYIKRILDIILSIVLLIPLLLITLIVGILIKFEDLGPVFFIDERIGKDFVIFNMYKFRTMKVGSSNILNKDGSTYNSENDPRVTKVGEFLRKTSIDELPQVFNILKGDMSFIGPRPSMKISLNTFKPDEIPKMSVLPGLTGYNQAYFRNSINSREKRLKDSWYSENMSFTLDVKIFLKTVQTVFKKENLYTNNNTNTNENIERNI